MKVSFSKVIVLCIAMLFIVGLLYVNRPTRNKAQNSLHYGSNTTKDFFENAYRNVLSAKPSDVIAGITVNHHLLAPNLIAQEFSLVTTDKPLTIVLISPNHFFRGNGGFISSMYDWQTPYGILETDQEVVQELVKEGNVNVDETPFEQEHGINNIVGFIKKSLPRARFIPIIIKENATDEKIDALAKTLFSALPDNALVVGSFDFSHYLPSNAADFHDEQALAAIHNFQYDRITLLDVDSHPALRLMLKYLELRGDKKFVVTSHSNSSKITSDFNFVETTSYINGYFTKGTSEYDANTTTLYAPDFIVRAKNQNNAFAKSWRLFQFNDRIIKSSELKNDARLGFLNVHNLPIAVGVVESPALTDIYLFPFDILDSQVKLLAVNKAGILLRRVAKDADASNDMKKQILLGHITIH